MEENGENVMRDLAFSEVLFEPPGLHPRVQQLRRAELVPLADRGPDAERPVPDRSGVRLPKERLIRRDPEQGDDGAEHVQALLLEVGLQDYV